MRVVDGHHSTDWVVRQLRTESLISFVSIKKALTFPWPWQSLAPLTVVPLTLPYEPLSPFRNPQRVLVCSVLSQTFHCLLLADPGKQSTVSLFVRHFECCCCCRCCHGCFVPCAHGPTAIQFLILAIRFETSSFRPNQLVCSSDHRKKTIDWYVHHHPDLIVSEESNN